MQLSSEGTATGVPAGDSDRIGGAASLPADWIRLAPTSRQLSWPVPATCHSSRRDSENEQLEVQTHESRGSDGGRTAGQNTLAA